MRMKLSKACHAPWIVSSDFSIAVWREERMG